jgi:hypothetical protein
MSVDQAFQAQAVSEKELLNKQNVVGVGVGYKESNGVTTDELAVVVLVERKKPVAALTPEDTIPRTIDGMRTDVVEVGDLRANQTPRDKYRPVVPSGVSIGHFKVTAGTLGTIVKDRNTGVFYILSNNHVLANSNDAALGDAVLQPAAMDGGQVPFDVVATLERFAKLRYIGDPALPPEVIGTPVPVAPTPTAPNTPPVGTPTNPPTSPTQQGCDILNIVIGLLNGLATVFGSTRRVTTQTATAQTAGGSGGVIITGKAQEAQAVAENLCDCALARPLDAAMFSDDIRQIGRVDISTAPLLGMRVRKFGRTTGYTEGTIKLLNATVNVGYSTTAGQKQARFVGQVIADPMSQGGDSGSLVVDAATNQAVGLLFAGSNLATIFTPIDVVLNTLGVTL